MQRSFDLEPRKSSARPGARSWRLLLGVSALSLAAVSAASPASAALPQQCASGSRASGYTSGYSLERNLLRGIWDRHFDCNTLEDFLGAVSVPFSYSPSPSPYVECRNVGVGDAILDTLRYVQEECTLACAKGGEDIGTLNARIYCGLPVYYSYSGQLHLCDLTTWQACRATFLNVVNANCQEKRYANPTDFDQFLEDACPAP